MDQDTYDLLTLALLYQMSWREEYTEEGYYKSWIGFDFGALNRLEDKGLLTGKHGNKSTWITPEGSKLAERIIESVDSDLAPALKKKLDEDR